MTDAHERASRSGHPCLRPSFWRRIRPDDSGCWIWTGYRSRDGYGRWWTWGSKSTTMAHRIAYEGLVGPIPDGLEIDHLCRVRACVNPAHLEPVTRSVNQLRGPRPEQLRTQWEARTKCQRGHDVQTLYRGTKRCRECQRIKYRERYRAAKVSHE